MSAPNKIYRHRGELRTSFASDTRLNDTDVEYIRKDALLEWLEDMKFMAKSERVGTYQNVIDILNKM